MKLIKNIGNAAGEFTGGLIGGTVRVVGELAGSNFIKDIGNGVESATKFAGRTAGELASGVWDVTAGAIKKDEGKMDEGLQDLSGAVTGTARGVKHVVVDVVENGANVVKGIAQEDRELLKAGAKGLVYTAAIGAIAIGFVDLVDGPDGDGV
jgi:uncharacterized cupin superfamily protein